LIVANTWLRIAGIEGSGRLAEHRGSRSAYGWLSWWQSCSSPRSGWRSKSPVETRRGSGRGLPSGSSARWTARQHVVLNRKVGRGRPSSPSRLRRKRTFVQPTSPCSRYGPLKGIPAHTVVAPICRPCHGVEAEAISPKSAGSAGRSVDRRFFTPRRGWKLPSEPVLPPTYLQQREAPALG
jgi:hypothetical protein